MPLASILFRPFGELLGHEEWVIGDGHHTLTLCRLLGHEHSHRKVFEDALLVLRSEEHTSELQPLMRMSYAVFCLKKNTLKKSSQPFHPASFLAVSSMTTARSTQSCRDDDYTQG